MKVKSLQNTMLTKPEVQHDTWEDNEASEVDMEGLSYWLLTMVSGLAGVILVLLAIIF